MRRITAVAAAMIVLTTLGACGGGDDDSAASGTGTDTSTSSDGGGDEEVTELDVCGSVSADEVGGIVGGTFTSELGPFDACEYDQEDPRATSVAIDAQLEADLGGGFAAYRSGTESVLTDGETVDVPGVGDEAFITTGRFGDGENTQLQGAVLIGGQVLTVNLTQASGITAEVLVDQATQLLTLVASKV